MSHPSMYEYELLFVSWITEHRDMDHMQLNCRYSAKIIVNVCVTAILFTLIVLMWTSYYTYFMLLRNFKEFYSRYIYSYRMRLLAGNSTAILLLVAFLLYVPFHLGYPVYGKEARIHPTHNSPAFQIITVTNCPFCGGPSRLGGFACCWCLWWSCCLLLCCCLDCLEGAYDARDAPRRLTVEQTQNRRLLSSDSNVARHIRDTRIRQHRQHRAIHTARQFSRTCTSSDARAQPAVTFTFTRVAVCVMWSARSKECLLELSSQHQLG